MNSSQATSNEDFLADCTTNVFSLADLTGLKWKKYASACVNSDNTENDPILNAYSIAHAADVLCVWRRVTQPGLNQDDNTPLFDCPKELIVFWYGDEPVLTKFPGPNLHEIEQGTSEEGISTDNLDIFFKAIHSVIEKNLLGDDFVRLGNWFTKPTRSENGDPAIQSTSSLAFSFSIFVHGESSVVASVNIKEKGTVRLLTKKDLQKISMSVGNFDGRVLLAPFGLNAHLTGHSIPDTDSRSMKILNEWKRFFPVEAKQANEKTVHINDRTSSKCDTLPMIVEVTLGEVKMLYPSSLVNISCTSLKSTAFKKKEKENVTDTTKIVDQVWRKLKKKEEPSSPSKQLWEFKDHSFQTGCKCCSNSNVSRVKSNTHVSGSNPFNPSYLYANSNSSNLSSKLKKDSNQSAQQSFFHQRQSKNDKVQGRVTPSLTGRSTPLLGNPLKPPSSMQVNIEKPLSASSTKPQGSIEQKSLLSVTEPQSFSTVSSTHGLSSISESNIKQLKVFSKDKPKAKQFYQLPKAFDFRRPLLATGPLESRTAETYPEKLEIIVKSEQDIASPGFVFHTDSDITTENIKNEADLTIIEDASIKKIKEEHPPAKRGPGRPKGRRNSALSSNQVMSPVNIEDELLSPNTRRHSTRQMLRGTRKRDSPTPSPKPDSPVQNGPGRPKKSRKPTRTGDKVPSSTGENAVFTFSNAVAKPISSVSSPTTPLLPPSNKPQSTSLTSQKDIEVSAADLMHLFDDEDDEDSASTNKLSSSNTSVLSPYSMDEHISSTTPVTSVAAISTHDLAIMFPTPPSLEDPHHHQTMSPTTIDSHQIMSHSIALLSPAQTPQAYEHENHSIRSPLMDVLPTFQLARREKIPMPEDYKPLKLPSESFSSLADRYVNYVPSWDTSWNPPLLSRRPSNNNRVSPTTSSTLSNTTATLRRQSSVFDSKLSLPSLISPTLSQRTFSDAATPSLMPQDHQSLLLNLRLNDSCISWMSKQTSDYNSTSVQDRTYRTFNIYQNLLWKRTMLDIVNQPLFPEDDPLERALGLVKKHVGDVQASKFPFSTDLIEILVKQFSSSHSIKYFHMLLSRYYIPNDEQSSATNTRSCPEKTSIQQQKLLLNLKPLLETAMQKPVRKTIFDKPKIEGPLTFREINNNNENNCSTVPSTSGLLFSYDSDTMSVSPDSIKHWQRLFLEPFSGPRNVEYIVVLPDTDIIVNGMKLFFKELNTLYESLHLGKHTPIVKDFRDGFLRISQRYVSQVADTTVDPWFDQSDSNIIAKMKVVAQFLKKNLGSYLANTVDTDRNTNKRLASPMSPNTPSNGTAGLSSITSNSLTVSLEESVANCEREHQPFIVLYMVDPFHGESKLNNYPSIWSYVGLMKCFLEMRSDLNDFLKDNLLLEIIPLEQILQLTTKTGQLGGPYNAELKKLALSVYTKCRPNPISYMNKIDKCMTGFGVCHIRENLIRRRKVEKNLPASMYMPPYILSPSPKYLNHDVKSATKAKDVFTVEKGVNALFCCYCLSTDKQWMFVSCTDHLGEINETTMIRIVYPKKKKNKALIWSVSLRKLWEFLSSVLSFSICQWRVIITKYGDVGQQELKEIQSIIDRNMEVLIPESKVGRPLSPLSEKCGACSNDPVKKGSYLYKSISFNTVRTESTINFVRTNGIRSTNAVNSRIYVMASRKLNVNSNKNVSSSNSSYGGGGGLVASNAHHHNSDFGDTPSLLNTSFEEDGDNFIPMLSSPVDSLFQSSPQAELSKILSPQHMNSPHNATSNISLSPFQPIQNKQQYITTPVKNTLSRDCEAYECLCEGYLVAMHTPGGRKNDNGKQNPAIIKSELLVHSASGETKLLYNPLDTNNHLEVLKCILEKFEMLSWLTVDPATGKRQSALPVHIKTVLLCQDILKWLTDG